MKKNSLFVLFITLRFPKPWCFLLCFRYFQEPLMSKGAPRWFHNVLTYNGEVIEY